MNLIPHLFPNWRPLCPHWWVTTGKNGFGIAVEQRCSWCEEYRHNLWTNERWVRTAWRPGPHPHQPDLSVEEASK